MNLPKSPVIALLLAALVACADDAPHRAAPADAASERAVVTVRIDRSRFDQPELAVAPGTTVRFVNDDPFAHTVTARADAGVAFDSGPLQQGDTFDITFDAPGTYRYFCEIHPTMRAVVVVG